MSIFSEIHVLLGSLTNKEEQIIEQNDEKKKYQFICHVM